MNSITTTIRVAHAAVSTRATWSYAEFACINKRHTGMNPARGPGGVS